MSAKAISEYNGKELLYHHLAYLDILEKPFAVPITENDSFDEVTHQVQWLQTKKAKAVIKPDQLIKRRGKHGLVKFGDLAAIKSAFNEMKGSTVKIGKTSGTLHNFIIEPFCSHTTDDEMYIAIYSLRDKDVIAFYEQGGIDVGDIDTKARTAYVFVQLENASMVLTESELDRLIGNCDADKKKILMEFIPELYKVYKEQFFTYLEINPIVVTDGKIHILDLAAKLDETALFLCSETWKTRSNKSIEFPAPFGRDLSLEEQYIADMDAKTGASLKLTILNRHGRIWTMVAGGGASVVFADTVCDLGASSELANYGEYSGDPSESQTYEYAKTILALMTEGTPRPDGKILIIGGSIANFTNVAATFKGIVRALKSHQAKLHEHNVMIYVRRGGPNYQEGLRTMKECGTEINIPIYVYGPETHMTAIVSSALGQKPLPSVPNVPMTTGQFLLQPETNRSAFLKPGANDMYHSSMMQSLVCDRKTAGSAPPVPSTVNGSVTGTVSCSDHGDHIAEWSLFEKNTKAIVWGQQIKAVQGMLDFDFVCRRTSPSVVASTYPFSGDHKQKFYFGHKEILIPAYKDMKKAFTSHPDASVLVTFASLRSVYDTVMEALQFPQLRVIAIIAEGVPENMTRRIIKVANEKRVTIIGPATVGGIKPGCFKIGNTGGMMDNILFSKLYRPGSVAYVSRSGGMSNELNNIIAQNTNGVFEGIAIGGDRYPGSTYMEHIMRYEKDDRVKMIVMLGEVGGVEEYKIVTALQNKIITKPLVAWCIGTCADYIASEVIINKSS
ncbi:hypothetical protein AB6A40_005038 [Gnathostoma spinigerum]|uniref:ATP citrate synthase n=1 Tax=Gnathostoma spinigerum TaxID=75299 RepID=A0ABD6EEA1_9BILA